MSDQRIRELVRSLLLDMKPEEVIAHVAHDLGFIPPLLRSRSSPLEEVVVTLVATDAPAHRWMDVFIALGQMARTK